MQAVELVQVAQVYSQGKHVLLSDRKVPGLQAVQIVGEEQVIQPGGQFSQVYPTATYPSDGQVPQVESFRMNWPG